MAIRIGNMVARRSYAGDIYFIVVDIRNGIALLKGTSHRLLADAPLEDLILVAKLSAISSKKLEFD